MIIQMFFDKSVQKNNQEESRLVVVVGEEKGALMVPCHPFSFLRMMQNPENSCTSRSFRPLALSTTQKRKISANCGWVSRKRR